MPDYLTKDCNNMLRKSIYPIIILLISLSFSASVHAQEVGAEPPVAPGFKT